jgi:hypothetical protein
VSELLKPMKHHAGLLFPKSARVRGRDDLGRVAIVKAGSVHTRVGRVAADGTVEGDSFLVKSRDLHDRQNLFKRPMAHHAGRTYPTTCVVRGQESAGRKFIVKKGYVETRIIDIGPDGKAVGQSHVVPSSEVIDVQTSGREIPVDDRGNLVIPADLRARLGLIGRCMVEILEQPDGFLVRPRSRS